jgi:hypothetical protein
MGSALAAGAVGGSAFAGSRAVPVIPEGGTLRVNVTGTDLGSLDPAINYDTDGGQLLYATCAKLVNYPDLPAPRGSMVQPEVASGMPTVSRDGRTYTFRVSSEFRFSNGAPVRAADFEYTIRRDLDPRMHSPAVPFLRDLVAYRASGDTLTLRLSRPAPDLLARLAMGFFSYRKNTGRRARRGRSRAPARTTWPRERRPLRDAEAEPHYSGPRPHHVDGSTSRPPRRYGSAREIATGSADYDLHGVPGGRQDRAQVRRQRHALLPIRWSRPTRSS